MNIEVGTLNSRNNTKQYISVYLLMEYVKDSYLYLLLRIVTTGLHSSRTYLGGRLNPVIYLIILTVLPYPFQIHYLDDLLKSAKGS